MSSSGDKNKSSEVMEASSSTRSTLGIYKTEIASILSSLIDRPVNDILPCVQYQTKARAGSGGKKDHSPFSVPIQRILALPAPPQPPPGPRSSGQPPKDPKVKLLEERRKNPRKFFNEVHTTFEELNKNKDKNDLLLMSVTLDKSHSLLLFDLIPEEFTRRTCDALYRNLSESEAQQKRRRRRRNSLENTNDSSVLGKRNRDESTGESQQIVIVNANPLWDEDPYSSLRRVALGGFISRLLNSQKDNETGDRIAIASGNNVTILEPSASLGEYNRLLGLDDDWNLEDEEGSEWAYEKIRHALTTNPATMATRNELDGFWYIDLTAVGYGKARVYLDLTPTLEFKKPTALILALVQLAHHMEAHRTDCSRYLWVIPAGRNHLADQVLCLGKMIFKDHLVGNADLVTQKDFNLSKRHKTDVPQHELQGFWTDVFEVVLYDPATGPDLWQEQKNKPSYRRDIRGLIDYATVRMKEIVVKNRGAPQDMDEDDMDDGDNGDGLVLDEAALLKMATGLSTSALVAASVGSRRRKQIRMDMTKVLDGKGNSGVFLQYVHSRLCGIERQSKTRLNPHADLSLLEETPEALALTIALAEWEDLSSSMGVISVNLDPSPLILYLFNVAAAVGQANRTMRVKGMRTEVAEARWLLFWFAKKVLDRGLWLLGLEPIGMM